MSESVNTDRYLELNTLERYNQKNFSGSFQLVTVESECGPELQTQVFHHHVAMQQ